MAQGEGRRAGRFFIGGIVDNQGDFGGVL